MNTTIRQFNLGVKMSIEQKRKKGKPFTCELDQSIGQKIRVLRINRGLAQKDLATILNVSIQQVQKYEKGINRLSLVSFIALIKSLKINPLEFLELDAQDDEHHLQYNDRQLKVMQETSKLVSTLDADVVRAVIAVLKALQGKASDDV